jgi:hypothetical protein
MNEKFHKAVFTHLISEIRFDNSYYDSLEKRLTEIHPIDLWIYTWQFEKCYSETHSFG